MLNYLSLFSGIGAFEKALTNLKIPYNLIGYSEIDKYASKSYSLIHGVSESLNLGDITKIDVNSLKPYCADLITYGFPCQDISIAGKQKGMVNVDGTLTRSGLFFEALKIIEHCKPKIAIAENVKNLTSKKFATQLETVLNSLEDAGYNNYWKVLNAKDYGIPQNRERVFIVSIRKDIDKGEFEFPKPFELKLRLKDFLENDVDEKYFLSKEQMDKKNISALEESKNIRVDIKEYNKHAKHQQDLLQHQNDICRCIPAGTHASTPHLLKTIVSDNPLKVRKLTPKECWRLQGFDDYDINKCIKAKLSNSQLYKQAGNSITVNVIEEILRLLLFDNNL